MHLSSSQRHRRNVGLFLRFAAVGASGVLVNLVALVVLKRLGPGVEELFLSLPFTRFNVRWYHVFSTGAFMVAILWNFQWNRTWTFHTAGRVSWWSEFRPFFTVGLLAHVAGLGLLTLLMHHDSPLGLPTDVLDDSTGLRTRLYWAQLAVIAAVTPLSFVLHKLWTFSSVRTHRLQASVDTDA